MRGQHGDALLRSGARASPMAMTPWTEVGRAIADEFARRAVEQYGHRLGRIVLFGSVARGTDGPESDVDLLVVAEAPDQELRDGLDALAFDLTLHCHRTPVFVLYPSEVYARARAGGSELVAAVEREGVPLWTRNDTRSSSDDAGNAAR